MEVCARATEGEPNVVKAMAMAIIVRPIMEMVGMGCSTEGDFEVGASETPSTAKDNLIEPQRSKKKND
jgi:hypothetical protein